MNGSGDNPKTFFIADKILTWLNTPLDKNSIYYTDKAIAIKLNTAMYLIHQAGDSCNINFHNNSTVIPEMAKVQAIFNIIDRGDLRNFYDFLMKEYMPLLRHYVLSFAVQDNYQVPRITLAYEYVLSSLNMDLDNTFKVLINTLRRMEEVYKIPFKVMHSTDNPVVMRKPKYFCIPVGVKFELELECLDPLIKDSCSVLKFSELSSETQYAIVKYINEVYINELLNYLCKHNMLNPEQPIMQFENWLGENK